MKNHDRNSVPRRWLDDLKLTDPFAFEAKKALELVKIYKLGEKGSGIRLQGAVQDFDRLKKECLSAGKLFEDPEFPAEDSSLFFSKRPAEYSYEIKWIRPPAIGVNPQFYVAGPSRFDVNQGSFGNCWMVASVANIAMHPNLLYQIVPQGQSFQNDYAGIFRFRFWQFGKWVEVVIDDRLPMYNGKLIGMHSDAKNEFWSSLLEKAYAKLHGYWAALTTGVASEALEDFTGGIAQHYKMENIPRNLFNILLEAQKSNSLCGCGISEKLESEKEEFEKTLGLVTSHAYTITKVMYITREISSGKERVPLLRMRNPWGHKEWNGAWSDGSLEWESIPEYKKKELDLVYENNGEFWIAFEDWKKWFSYVEICYLNPSFMMTENNNYDNKNWEANSVEGEWVRGATAGGFKDSTNFEHNPQYLITLDKESTVIVALMQKNRRTQRPEGGDFLDIGFHIYKLPDESKSKLPKPLDTEYILNNAPLNIESFMNAKRSGRVRSYSNRREICRRIKLPPGVYCIIVRFTDKDREAEFLLRVFSEIPNNLEEYDDQVGLCEPDEMVVKQSDADVDTMELRNVFRKLAGNDWEFDWREYKEILDFKLRKELFKEGFSKDACRSMVALLDADCSGKLGYHELKTFWKDVKIWKTAFAMYNPTDDGYLKPFTLKQALKSAGFRLDRQILNLCMRRYGTEDGHIRFDDFFMCALRLKKMMNAFKDRASVETNTATLTIGECIKATLYLG